MTDRSVTRVLNIVGSTVALAAVWHIVIGLMICLVPTSRGTSATAAVTEAVGSPVASGVVLVLAGVAGLLTFAAKNRAGLLWALPQQGVLCLNAWAALKAASAGMYPDGTLKPAEFILTDQMVVVLLAMFHLAATMTLPGRRGRDS